MRNPQSLISFTFLCKLVTYWLILPPPCHPARAAHVACPTILQPISTQKTLGRAAPSPSAWTALSLLDSLCTLSARPAGRRCINGLGSTEGFSSGFPISEPSFSLLSTLNFIFSVLCPWTCHLSRKVTWGFCRTPQGRAERLGRESGLAPSSQQPWLRSVPAHSRCSCCLPMSYLPLQTQTPQQRCKTDFVKYFGE